MVVSSSGAATEAELSRRARFERDGFLHLKAFCSPEECARLRGRMAELIDAWDPEKTLAPIFVTDTTQQLKAQGSSDYFLDSADRVHFFLEKDASAGEGGGLRPGLAKHRALNKVGHGLHVTDSVFREYSTSEKVKDLVAELGWIDPVLPQSMYIFKQPEIGGEVTSHQDSTFLYTTPRPTCVGLWLALHSATLENGCLWARPGSHKEPVRRHFVRNPKHFDEGDSSASQMIFEDLDVAGRDGGGDPASREAWTWEGKMPEGSAPPSDGLHKAGFKPVICEAGDLVVIHGQVDHLSLPNTSGKPRETYQLHLVEGPGAGITWSAKNWLQYPGRKPFPSLASGGVKRKEPPS
eukprot:TRINITY_DN5410_c0_g1_i1.p2 TRINITY_DN5410_c0_g1~~TRINITY_DN5410_c0_g1_i1.p2  ORF type:complete len:381 (+),score=80.62 TRINITY_DN5410_c0_g1_i1:93-1145(+)